MPDFNRQAKRWQILGRPACKGPKVQASPPTSSCCCSSRRLARTPRCPSSTACTRPWML
jgi:hypothetical protein